MKAAGDCQTKMSSIKMLDSNTEHLLRVIFFCQKAALLLPNTQLNELFYREYFFAVKIALDLFSMCKLHLKLDWFWDDKTGMLVRIK